MLNQNADLYLIRLTLDQLRHLVDELEAERQHNARQDRRLSEHDSRLGQVEKKCEEMLNMYQELHNDTQKQQIQLQKNEESIDFAIAKVDQFEYLIARNEELEYRENFYSLDGEANCNS